MIDPITLYIFERAMEKEKQLEIYDVNSMDPDLFNQLEPQIDKILKMSREEDNKFAKRYKEKYPVDRPYILNTMKGAGSPIVLTINQNIVIGFVFILPRYNDNDIRFGMLHDLIIHPKYRGQGYGTILMNKIVDVAKKNGLKYLELNVWDNNLKAKSMYSKHNFVTVLNRMRKSI